MPSTLRFARLWQSKQEKGQARLGILQAQERGSIQKKEKGFLLFSSYHVPGPGEEPCLYLMNPHNT